MSARTIKNPATVSGQGNLASDSLTLSNTVNCVLSSNATGDLLANGVPVGGGGGGGVDAVLAGDGISVVTASGDATVTNEGVLELTAGANVTITGTKDNYTINSSGGGGAVDSVTAGEGISVTGTTDVTVSNTGVLALTAGSNITITGTSDNLTINGAASGGAVDSLIAGDGISVSGTTDVTVSNTGVLSIVAGDNITTSEAAGVVTVNSSVNSNIGALRFYYTFPVGTTPQQLFLINDKVILNFIGQGISAYVMTCNGGSDGPFVCNANFFSIVGADTKLQIYIRYVGPETLTAQQSDVNFSIIAYNF